MNRRSIALLAAVITFSVGVFIARSSLVNWFETSDPPVIKEIQLSNYRLSGPYAFENLSVFLIRGANAPKARVYTPLQAAMKRGFVIVHETSNVNELAIENLAPSEEVFVQAGQIVKGGKQDRVLSVDLILPAQSGMVPISAFCVEQSRWNARGSESGDHFTLTEMAAPFSLRRVIKEVATQTGVWDEVNTAHESIAAGVAGQVRSVDSPTSLPLALESDAVQDSTERYVKSLSGLTQRWNDVIGFAFTVNGEMKGADVYSSNVMFAQFWPRLLKAAAVEAVASRGMDWGEDELRIETVGSFLTDAELGEEMAVPAPQSDWIDADPGLAVPSKVNSRTQSVKRVTENSLFFESRDNAYDGAWIHRSYLSRISD